MEVIINNLVNTLYLIPYKLATVYTWDSCVVLVLFFVVLYM